MRWEIKNLGQFCSLVNGKVFKANDWSELGLPIIRIQNLNDSTKPFNHWDGRLDRQVHVQEGDLLIAWSGTPGTSFGAHLWSGPKGVLNQHIFRVDLVNGAVTKEWLKFCVNIQLLRLIDKAHGGVGLKHVTKGAVESVQIPLPPLAEQKRIAGILDAADALRAKRRDSLALLDTLLKSTFLDMFGDPVTNPMGWEVIPFDKLGEFVSGSTPSKAREEYWLGLIPWVSPKDMKVSLIFDAQDHVSDSAFYETNLKLLEPGHLLIVVRGMILAHSFPVAINRVPVAINQDMKGILPSSRFDVSFLFECIRQLKRQLLSEVSTAGHGTKRFDAEAMKKVHVPLPPP